MANLNPQPAAAQKLDAGETCLRKRKMKIYHTVTLNSFGLACHTVFPEIWLKTWFYPQSRHYHDGLTFEEFLTDWQAIHWAERVDINAT